MRTVVLVGHVDHGKTALAARLCASWGDPAASDEPAWRLVDTPGPKHFLRSMLAGLSQNDAPDVAVVVVSAADDELKLALCGGQLQEYLRLVRCVGIPSVIVWINKLDQVVGNGDETDELARAARSLEIQRALQPNLNRLRFDRVTMLAGSACTGQGLDELHAALKRQPRRRVDPAVSDVPQMTTKRLTLTVQLFGASGTFITSGAQLVLHGSGGVKREVEVVRCLPKLLRGQAQGVLQVTFLPAWIVQVGATVVLRNEKGTIGVGRVSNP
jgi:translation initiation factor IF-2